MNTLTYILPALTLLLIFWFFNKYRRALLPKRGTLEWIFVRDRRPLTLAGRRFPMERRDLIPLAVIVALYASVAFYGLGDRQAPETFWETTEQTRSVTVDLGQSREISYIMYYTGLFTGNYSLETSLDGSRWTVIGTEDSEAMPQKHSELFKWQYVQNGGKRYNARYIKITADRYPLCLGELAIYSGGELLNASGFTVEGAGAWALFDEQDVVPPSPNYLNSAYFDEIYHARTAYEHYTNVYPYEVSHPPLGKIIIMLGVHLFGMNPFGWRFMGALFGVLMLIPFYILIKNLFGRTIVAACGTLIFAFDFMHFVQTRIATIDTYGVMFIILSYFFMYRYITSDHEAGFKKTCLPLLFSGISFGVGCACKWTVIYAGAGLLALYAVFLILRWRHYRNGFRTAEFVRFLMKTLLFSVLCFIILPAGIYCLSYIPYGLASGMTIQGGMLTDPDYYKIVWDNQKFMLNYHAGVSDSHPYESQWWMWLADARPILYYLSYDGDVKSSFGAFNNPVVAWAGLIAVLTLPYMIYKRGSAAALFILVGYLSQIVPWIFISRTTFAYHYFPSTVFLVLAICYVFNNLLSRNRARFKRYVPVFTGACLGLFALFYPVLNGMPVYTLYGYYLLKWFPSWPFGA